MLLVTQNAAGGFGQRVPCPDLLLGRGSPAIAGIAHFQHLPRAPLLLLARNARTTGGSVLPWLGIVTHGGRVRALLGAQLPGQQCCPWHRAMCREMCCSYSHPRKTWPSEGCTSFFASCKLLAAGTASSPVRGKCLTRSVRHRNVINKNTLSYYTVSVTTKVHL